jgi:N-carbamoyl-L-amino-acid hydrolase
MTMTIRISLSVFLFFICTCATAQTDPDSGLPLASAERVAQRIMELSAFGKNPEGGVSRVAFSQHDIDGRQYIRSLMTQAGLEVRIDAAGNLIGSKAGQESLPPIMLGSHIDSVPAGGNYDGDVGVIGALEVAQLLHENRLVTRHPLEIVVFSDEEGGLSGSRAMIGHLDAAALKEMSHSGMTIAEGIRAIGGDPDKLSESRREAGDITAFVELHIEQGAILDIDGIDIGVVTGIVGIQWWEIVVKGMANHAGTTPMNKRRDAMLSAAELALTVNEIITSVPGAQVATVGSIHAEPGAPNVIPGKVTMSLEIRDLSNTTIWSMFGKIEERAAEIATRRGTPITFTHNAVDAEPALTDPGIRKLISESAKILGLSQQLMPSGAGHDAQDLAQITPTGMVFVPSVGGISHSPDEYTRPEDIANGANVLLHTVLAIDQSRE